MTKARAFRRQAQADLDLYLLLQRRDDVLACHTLHCLQMAAEKLAKAILYAGQRDFDTQSHVLFTKLLRYLSQERVRVAEVLGYTKPPQVKAMLAALQPLAHAVEVLHPQAGARNVEYPWQDSRHGRGPEWTAPADHHFQLLDELKYSRKGSQLVDLIRRLLDRFEALFP